MRAPFQGTDSIRRVHRTRGTLLSLVLVGCGLLFSTCGGDSDPSLTPVTAKLLALFESSDLLCLGEEHGHRGDAQLREALVRHAEFANTVDLILVEFINPVHQEVVDRLVLDGEEVPRSELRIAWLDAGLGAFWEVSHYEDFLRLVAEVNRDLPAPQRIPILGSAPPIHWETVTEPDQLFPYLDRQEHYAERVTEAVLDPGFKGLAIFGAGHCERTGMGFPAWLPEETLTRVVSARSIPTAGRDTARALGLPLLTTPQWIAIRDTERARWSAGDLFFEGHVSSGVKLGQLFDGVVDFGTKDYPIDRPDRIGLSAEWQAELVRRSRLLETAKGSRDEEHPSSPVDSRPPPTLVN